MGVAGGGGGWGGARQRDVLWGRSLCDGLVGTVWGNVCAMKAYFRYFVFLTFRNVRRILVRGVNAPLPPEAKENFEI